MKKKIIITIVFVFSLVALFLVGDYLAIAKGKNYEINNVNQTINLDSSLFTQKESEEIVEQAEIDFIADGFSQDYANSEVIFYSNIETGAIRITNKKTGYTWSSDVLFIDQYNFNNAGLKQVQSAFTLVYRDKDDKVKQVRTKETKVSLSKKVSDNEISFHAEHSESGISFDYKIIVNGHKFTLLFDHTSIKEDKCRLTNLTFFPYLGSAYKQEMPGYAFIPSGSGALIRFNQEPTISAVYQSAFYGEDANFTTNNEGDLLNLPIYGFVHGYKQNALLVNIKEGASFAKLNYSPSSIDEGFHMVYPNFNYRETYQLNFSTNSFLVIPEDYYKSDIEIEYTILDGENASYVGMAKDYQQTLEQEGILERQTSFKSDISLDLEVFGRDYETGLILRKYYNMTKTSDVLDFNTYLTNNNVKNIIYCLRAFNKNGYSSQSVTNYQFDKKLGSLNDLKNLEAYFYYNPIESYASSKKYPSKVLVNMKNEKNYIKVGVDKYKFYANLKDVLKNTTKATKEYYKIVLDGIGYRIYGDHNNNITKTEAIQKVSAILGNQKYPLYSPNYYMLKNTDKYLNMPLYAERLRFFSDSVPFLEILLKGYIDYYSPYLNFSSNEKMDVLKCIEYGCYPAYLVTKQESYLLADTLSSNYYATTFAKQQDAIVKNYHLINEALKPVIGATIVERKSLDVGVYQIIYSNNYQIFVNYTNQDYTVDEVTIPSLGYIGGAV